MKLLPADLKVIIRALHEAADAADALIEAWTPRLGMEFDTPMMRRNRKRYSREVREYRALLARMEK